MREKRENAENRPYPHNAGLGGEKTAEKREKAGTVGYPIGKWVGFPGKTARNHEKRQNDQNVKNHRDMSIPSTWPGYENS